MTQIATDDVLPAWNLDDLYPGRESPELSRDFDWLETAIAEFAHTYEGKVAGLDGDGLFDAVTQYERIEEVLGRIGSYAGLVHAGDLEDTALSQFYQTVQERLNELSSQLLFFTLEINRLEERDLEAKLQSDTLAAYRPWFRDLRIFRPYQLSDELERLFHEKSVSGSAAWSRSFDETIAGLRFDVDGETKGIEQTLDLLSASDRPRRRAAAQSLAAGLSENIRVFSLITNTLAKDKEIEDRWRKLETPAMSRHLSNQVEPEIVEALVTAVRRAYPRISHRYYQLKARWMNLDKLEYWDRNAPLPESEERSIPWDQARTTVLEAYQAFAPEMGEVAQSFFEKNWIDAQPRPGKAPGAFSHPTVPAVHPYVLLHYLGKSRDVMTLAHELGHGVHQVLAAPRGALMSHTPLTLAETASVFGEMLTFQSLLKQVTTRSERKIMIAMKVEDMINTVVRQVAFYEFEQRIHERRRKSELTPDEISAVWMEIQQESLGPAFHYAPEYSVYWTYIPHFIHSPFYVYAYAFGDCLVNSLFAVYQNEGAGFAAKYLDLLRAGGTLRHKELLAPFGLNAGDPKFWEHGLGVISGLIDELETL